MNFLTNVFIYRKMQKKNQVMIFFILSVFVRQKLKVFEVLARFEV